MNRKAQVKGSKWRKKVMLLLITIGISLVSFSQAVTNTGKEFWVGYGHHQYMETSCDGNTAGDNTMNMRIYLSNTSNLVAHVTLTIDSSNSIPNTPPYTSTYTINPNSVIETENMPKGTTNSINGSGNTNPNFDARLWTERPPAGTGGEGIFRGKGIHIVSDVPIVSYAHIYGGVSSGATMLLPIESWGYSYTSVNSEQGGAVEGCYSWMYVIAKEDNTVVEITPSEVTRLNKPAWVPFQVTLMKGQIYQLVGQADCVSGSGVQLTGTKIRSVSGGFGDCKPIAVFSGSSRTGGEAAICGASGRDNDMQQCYPQQAWGTRYLTSPFSSSSGGTLRPSQFQNGVFKVAVKDPATAVKRNGVLLSNSTVKVAVVASATSICPGTSVKFTAIPENGGLAPTYQWKINGVDVPGGTDAAYVTDTLKNGDNITCSIVSNAVCITTNTATSTPPTYITVANSVVPSVSIYSTSESLCGSSPIDFKAIPTNGGTPSYQWIQDNIPVGINSDTYSLSSPSAGNVVKCVMTSTASCISTSTANSNVITLNNNASITPGISISADQDVTQSICGGTPVTFTAIPTNGGNNPTFQWMVNTIPVGTNSSTFTTSTLAFGDLVTCKLVSSAACASPASATSNPPIYMIIGANLTPTMEMFGSSKSLCGSSTTKFVAVPKKNCGSAPIYQWYLNNTPVGTNDSIYTVTGLKELDQIKCTIRSSLTSCLNQQTVSVTQGMQTPNLINRSYYIYQSQTADYIEADKAVMVAQYMSNGTNCNGGSGDGDPEMVFLSPIDQGIKKAVFYSTNLQAILSNYVYVILPTSALPSLRINNSNIFSYTYNITNKPGYSVAIKGWAATKFQWTITCDSGFNAITYGMGGAESYAYNAGTNLNNIDGLPAYHNIPDTSALSVSHPYTYVGSPMVLRTNVAFKPSQMVWKLSYLGCSVVTPCTDVTVVNPVPNDSVIIGTAKYYQYSLPGNYVFNIPGTYNLPIELTSPNLDNGNCSNKETVSPEILVKYKPSMLFNYTQAIGCGVDTIRFLADTITPELYKIIKYKWQFTGNVADTSNLQNPSFYFATPGTYPVKLSIITLYGGIADTTINVTVTGGSQAHSNFGANPSTICLGQPINFVDSTGYFQTDYWYWDFGDGHRDTVNNNLDRPYTYTATGTYLVRHTVMGTGFACLPDTVTRTVIVALTPTITSVTPKSPTNCVNGTDGGIYVNGLLPNTPHSLSYVFNGNTYTVTATSNASGVAMIPNLVIGTYSNVVATIGNCSSTSAGPVTITSPPPPAAPTAGSNTPVCSGTDINLTSSPFIAGGTYAWTGPNGFTSNLPNPTIAGSTVTTASAGNYFVTVTVNSCVSSAGSTTVAVNNIPLIGSVTTANPTTCATATGSITLNGLLSNTSYVVHYSSATGAQTATITSSGSGSVVVPNLGSGTYTAINVTLGACSSNNVGPYTLSDPNPPATPVASVLATPICAGGTINLSATSSTSGVSFEWTGPSYTATGATQAITNATVAASGSYTVVAKLNGCTSLPSNAVSVLVNPVPPAPSIASNAPICASSTLNLTSSGVTGTATYTWSGPNSFTSSVDNPSITNATVAASGNYTLTVTQNGCTSPASSPITATVNAVPAISGTASSNPTNCSSSTGSITLNGLLALATYTVNYTSATGAQTLSIAATASGTVVIPNLPAGTYSNISVSRNACASNTVGPITLTDPAPPAIPVASVLVTPICAGSTINLSATSSTSGVSFEWTGPSYTATGATQAITNATVAASGSYTVVAKLNGCTSLPSNAVSVVVNPIPATPTVASNSPICAGSTLNLTSSGVTGAATYTWAGPNSFTSGAANPSITNTTVAASGNYTLTVTQNGCTSLASAPASVTVNAVPAISSSSLTNATTCATATGTITLNGLVANTAYTVSYSAGSTPETATITSNGSGTVVISGLTAGTYSNMSVTLNNCTSNVVGPFTIADPTPPPPPTLVSNNSPICSGSSIVLTASTSTSGAVINWTSPSGVNTTGATFTLPNAATTDAGVYNVKVTLNGCNSSSVPATVVVKATPVISSSSSINPTNCGTATGSITLNGLLPSTSYTVTFVKNSGSQTLGLSSNASGSITIANLFSASYSNVAVTLNGCTSAAVGPFILSDPAPPATPVAISNSPICNGSTLNLSATSTTAGASFNWTGPNSFVSAVAAPSIPNATAAATGTYNVTATLNSCTSPAYSISVVVNTTPVISGAPSTANPSNCNGANGSITLNGLAASTSYTVNYTKNTVAQTATISSNASGVLTIPALTAGTYAGISVTLGTCTSNIVGPVTLTDPAPPAVPVIAGTANLCEGSALNLVASSTTAGTTYAWTSTVGYSTTGNTANIAATTTANSGTYTVTATLNSCTSSASQAVVVSPYPTVAFSMPAFVCMPNGVANFGNQTTVTGGGSLTYTWDFGDLSAPATTTDASHIYASIGSYPVKLTATSNGCSKDLTKTFSAFYDKPVAAFTINKDTVCQGVQNVFTDASTAPNSTIASWAWNFGDGTPVNIQTSPTKTYGSPGTYPVTLVVKNAQGCTSDALTKNIKVYLQPVIDAGPSFVVPQGTTVVFNPKTNDSTTVTFAWTPAGDFANPNILRPSLVVMKNQQYTVTATGLGKCTAVDTMHVVALKPLTIPNAFSPNGDGINDKWDIVNLSDYSFAIVEIFNRNGQSVFKSYGYSNPWDGKYNGKSLPVGTYYYIMDFKGVFPQRSGYVVILR